MTTTLHRFEDTRLAAVLSLLLAAAGLALANFGLSDGENGGAGAYAVSIAICGFAAAALFGRILPRAADPLRAGWILAALALVTCLVFWTGLPFVFGLGAMYSASRAGKTAPAAVGALAVVLAFAGCVVG